MPNSGTLQRIPAHEQAESSRYVSELGRGPPWQQKSRRLEQFSRQLKLVAVSRRLGSTHALSEERRRAAVEAILRSGAPKKVIVAGPGTGKTSLFRELLEQRRAGKDRTLILTFTSSLKDELEKDLGHLAQVFTFHGYCRHLLHRIGGLRRGLSEHFRYFPALVTLIKRDWEVAREGEAPQFVRLMREAAQGNELNFYVGRADYYDAVSFDDSEYRVWCRLVEQPELVSEYDLVLVDEYQDFNLLEALLIDLLAKRSAMLIAGDDDQALYVNLRAPSPRFIRELWAGGEYECFGLPYCMRCTAPIIGAVDDIVRRAQERGKLRDRVAKEYEFFPPAKGADTERYPRIKVVETSVQRKSMNYLGRYIEQQLRAIPPEEVAQSRHGRYPTVLIIGPAQYLRQVQEHLEECGYQLEIAVGSDPFEFSREDGLRLVREQERGNLGWRVMLELDQPEFYRDVVIRALSGELPLVELVPAAYRDGVLNEIHERTDEKGDAEDKETSSEEAPDRPTIRMTSFEGSKGLSAQHVFILGLQDGDLPRNRQAIDDLEVCRFLVAMTRTRKQCHLMYTRNWGGQWKDPSIFIEWIEGGGWSSFA